MLNDARVTELDPPEVSVPSVGQCSTNPVWQKRVIWHVVVRTNKRTAANPDSAVLPSPISLTIGQFRFTRRGLAAASQAGKFAASPTEGAQRTAQFVPHGTLKARNPVVHFLAGRFSSPALSAEA